MAEEQISRRVVMTIGGTYDNKANLAKPYIARLARMEGTRLGRQELYGEILEDVAGANWTVEVLERCRIMRPKVPPLKRIVVGVDPAVTNVAIAEQERQLESGGKARKLSGAETGIVVAGLGVDGCAYVLGDYSIMGSPLVWARRVHEAYTDHKASRVVAEKNNGGDLVESNLRAIMANLPLKLVFAKDGKITRAEPVSSLYERTPSMVYHVGVFPELEEQMLTYTGDPKQASPDRMDALVWALTELMLDSLPTPMVGPVSVEGENFWRTSYA